MRRMEGAECSLRKKCLRRCVMSDLFQPYRLAGIRLPNRIIRSSTHEGLAEENGFPTLALTQKYLQLAKGGVGAIISGYAGVQPDGRCAYHRMLMIDQDASVSAYRGLVNAVHAQGTPIFLQVGHCGRQTRSKVTGLKPVAPSAIRDKHFNEETPAELTEFQIEAIINNFVKAIIRAKAAGFDGIQLNACHGYLLSEFLSPYMNRRSDQWGGNTENRFRIIAEIFQRAKSQVKDYPLLIKINGYDGRKNGMRVEEAVNIAKRLEACGCAAIEVSCGVSEDKFYTIRNEVNPVEAVFHYSFKIHNAPIWLRPLLKPLLRRRFTPLPTTRLYNVPAAQAIKQAVSIPVIVVGGIKTLKDITSILDNQQADLVSLCRPLILEPDLIEKFRIGKQTEAKCIACNYCALGIESGPLRCHFGKLRTNV